MSRGTFGPLRGRSISLGHLLWPPFLQRSWHSAIYSLPRSRGSVDSFFTLFSLAFSGSWKVVKDLGFDCLIVLLLSLFLRFPRPKEHLPFLIFRKLLGMTLLSTIHFYWTFLQRHTSPLSLSSEFALFTSLVLNAVTSFIPFDLDKRQPQAWWFFEVEEVVKGRRKAFASAHKMDEKRQAYTSVLGMPHLLLMTLIILFS